jgi:hypothetical protein
MPKRLAALTVATIVLAGALAAPSLHAATDDNSSDSVMRRGISGHGMMGGKDENGGMMNNMRGMMKMMKHMTRMMDRCNGMMGSGRPNGQWRNSRSEAGDKGE